MWVRSMVGVGVRSRVRNRVGNRVDPCIEESRHRAGGGSVL